MDSLEASTFLKNVLLTLLFYLQFLIDAQSAQRSTSPRHLGNYYQSFYNRYCNED
jgi:hypothetical protein